jgi:TM2 domain-containing membrane protein YozV
MNRGKNKLVAALLAFFLGGFGGHHFYLGSMVSGIICLVTCGGFGLIWLIEFIMLLVMSDEDFDKRYNQRAPEGLEFVFMTPK